MSKIYCKNCNQPTEYSSTKPSFCSVCGKAFAAIPVLAVITPTAEKNTNKLYKKPTKYNPEEIEDDEDEGGDDGVVAQIDISKIEVEPIEDFGVRRQTVKDLMFNNPKPLEKRDKVKNRQAKKTNKKEVLESFKNETKSCRRGNTTNSSQV